MGWLSRVVKVCGMIAICYPHNFVCFRRRSLKFPIGFLQIIHIIVILSSSMSSFYDLFAKTANDLSGSDQTSQHLSFYLGYLTNITTEIIIRFSSLFYAGEILEVITIFQLHSRSHVTNPSAENRRPHFWFVSGALLVSAVVFGGTIEATVKAHKMYENFSEYIPPSATKLFTAIRIFTTIMDILSGAALAYSCLFVVVYGTALVNWHGHCVEKLKNTVEEIGGCFENYSRLGLMFGRSQELGNVVEEFKLVRQTFLAYGKISGCYLLAIIVNSVLKAIRYLSYGTCAQDWVALRAAGTLLNNGLAIPAILFYCNFGHYMGSSIHNHANKIRTIEVEAIRCQNGQMAQAMRWLQKWSWKLSAVGMFDVSHGLILSCSATIMTYYILLVQLKTSENFPSQPGNNDVSTSSPTTAAMN